MSLFKMPVYNIVLNDVQKTKNKIMCLARIDNYRNVLKHVTVGESIRTDPFELDFDSIGSSTWTLIFFPKGQYIAASNSIVTESGQASMYLKMVDCEHQNNLLAMTIRFFIKSPYCDVLDKFSTSDYAVFSYRNLTERWTGPFDLAAIEELYSSRCKNLFLNDSLTIGCELDDTTFRARSPPSTTSSNGSVFTTDTSNTEEQNLPNVGHVWMDNPLTSRSSGSYKVDQRSRSVGFKIGDTTFQSPIPPSMMQSTENVHSAGSSYQRSAAVESRSGDAKIYPRTPRKAFQPRDSPDIFGTSRISGKHSLPVEHEPDKKVSRKYSPRSPTHYRDVKTSFDTKLENNKESRKESPNIAARFNDMASHKTGPRVHSKDNVRRASTSNADDTVDELKGTKRPKRMSVVEELSMNFRNMSCNEREKKNDSSRENEKRHLCACGNSNETIDKETKGTQTWSHILRSCSDEGDRKRTVNVHQLTSPCV